MSPLIFILSLISRYEFVSLPFFLKIKKVNFYYSELIFLVGMAICSGIMIFTPYNSYYMKLYSLLTLFVSYIVWKQRLRFEYFLYFSLIAFYILFFGVVAASYMEGISVRLGFSALGEFLGFSVNYILSFFSIFLVYFVFGFQRSFINEVFFISSLFFILLTESRFFSIVVIVLLFSRYVTTKKNLFYLVAAFLLIASLLFFFYPEYLDSRIFKKGIEDTRRAEFLNCYIESLSVYSFLFGSPFELCPVIIESGYNPHNSLIKFHSMYGIFAIFMTVMWSSFIIYQSIKYSFKLLFLFFVVYFSRFFIDSFYLFTLLDLMVVVVLVSLKGRNFEKYCMDRRSSLS